MAKPLVLNNIEDIHFVLQAALWEAVKKVMHTHELRTKLADVALDALCGVTIQFCLGTNTPLVDIDKKIAELTPILVKQFESREGLVKETSELIATTMVGVPGEFEVPKRVFEGLVQQMSGSPVAELHLEGDEHRPYFIPCSDGLMLLFHVTLTTGAQKTLAGTLDVGGLPPVIVKAWEISKVDQTMQEVAADVDFQQTNRVQRNLH